MRRHWDLALAALAAAVCALGGLFVPVEAISVLFAAPLALFLPGYAVVSLSLAGRRLDWTQTLALSLGVSLAVLVIGSLLLNYLGGLHPGTWAAFLVVVVVGAAAGAARRRTGLPERRFVRPHFHRSAIPSIAFVVVGLLVGTGAVALAFVPFAARHAIGYTELWFRQVDGGSGVEMRIGVGNQQHQRATYLVRAQIGNEAQQTRQVTVEPGETVVVELPAGEVTAATPVAATLFRASDTGTPLRHVWGWLHPVQEPE